MTLVILAAGQGSRLRPLTDDRPKCMVHAGGSPLLEWQVSAARAAGIDRIVVVRGYRKDAIHCPDLTYVENQRYATTNMVETLWCAEALFGDGFVMAYGDILYEPVVLETLLAADGPTSVVVDQAWLRYWKRRFDHVLSDAESLQVDGDDRIVSIGQQAESLSDIQGQYIGLVKFDEMGVRDLRRVYSLAASQSTAGHHPFRGYRPLEGMYMTDLLQGMVDEGAHVRQVPIQGGWLEIDTLRDLDLAQDALTGRPGAFRITRW